MEKLSTPKPHFHRALLLLALILTCALQSRAEKVTIDDINYEVSGSSATVTGCSSSVTALAIPDKITYNSCSYAVTSIGNNAFYRKGLKSVTIPNSVASIGEYAFEFCGGLTSVTIPNSVTSIGNYSFYGCSGLTAINVSKSVKSIGEGAFGDCSNLISVNIEDLAAWCSITFDDYSANPLYYAHNLYLNGVRITDLTIPNSVTSIGNYAFKDCLHLTELKFDDGNNVLTLAEQAFKDTSALKEIYFGRQMRFTYVPCYYLETVEFGENVTSIEGKAFSTATSLRSITAHGTVPPTIYESTFATATYNLGTLHVKKDAINDYKTADGWKNFCNVAAYDITDGINEVGNDNNTVNDTQVSVADGAICIAGDADVRIVSMNGTTIYNGRGNISVNVAPGIYVVLANGTATKVAVK